MNTVSELPFANYFFDTNMVRTKNPYESMKTLIESYGLGFTSFMHRLSEVSAVIGGSAVTRVFMKNKIDYDPDDIDIFVMSDSDLRPVVAYLEAYGYSMDMGASMTLLEKAKGRSAIDEVEEPIDEDDVEDDMLATYRQLQKKISEVWTYRNGSRKLQIVLLRSGAPIDFVRRHTDLSCTAIAYITWSSFYHHMKPYAINKQALYHLRRNEMYIQDRYKDVLAGGCGLKRREKLLNRIEKYIGRGFTLIDEPSIICVKVDPRSMRVADKYKAHDIIAAEDISVEDAMKDRRNILVYTAPGIAYSIDRYEMVKFCKERGATYWNHRLMGNHIHRFRIEDYSVYTIMKNTRGSGHKVQGYTMKNFYNKHKWVSV
jgi:hypothetical protein